MKNKFSNIISLITCIALIICLFKIYSLEEQISQLKNTVNNQRDYISRDINAIYNNIDNMLKERASMIVSEEWSFVNADIENAVVTIKAQVTGKEFTPGVTTATLVCDGQEFDMTLLDGRFQREIQLPLFENTVIDTICFAENGIIRTEKLDWHIEPRYEYLTLVYADMNWGGRGIPVQNDEEKIYIWTVDNGDINIDAERKGRDVEIQSIHLVEQVNGVETKRTSIPLTKPSRQDKAEAAGVNMPVPESAVYTSDYGHVSVTYDISGQSFEIPYGGTLQLFIETVDGDGLVHRNQLQCWTVDENGEEFTEDFEWWHGAESDIYDADGNLLFGTDWSQYK